MQKDLVQTFLRTSGMDSSQAEALSHILGEMATRDDLRFLGQTLEGKIEALDRKVEGGLHALKAELTWRFFGGLIALGALMTVLDRFID